MKNDWIVKLAIGIIFFLEPWNLDRDSYGFKQMHQISTAQLYLPLILKNADNACFGWHNQIALQTAINQHICVVIQSGIWTTNIQLSIPSGHRILGEGYETTILRAVEPWLGNGAGNTSEAVLHNNSNTNIVISNITIDANRVSTFGVASNNFTLTSSKIIQAKCDGIAINGSGVNIKNNIVEYNGLNCPTDLSGSGIYMTKSISNSVPADYSPLISGNTIRYNGGPGIDIDRVWGGSLMNNTISENQAWAAVSIYSASYWTIEQNTIYHPSDTDPVHPGHLTCVGGPQGNHPTAIAICQDTGNSDQASNYNTIQNNQIASWYGIQLIGNDETQPSWIPRYNTIQNNDVYGSVIGCIDDFEPQLGVDGLNTWVNNNCAGKSDTLPLYFDVLCPSAVRRSTVLAWNIGEADVSTVDTYITLFNAERTGGGDFGLGAAIPDGVVIATSFTPAGLPWNYFPVQPIVHYQDYGLFETTEQYISQTEGACLTIIP